MNFTVDQVREILPLLVHRGIGANVLMNPREVGMVTTFTIQLTDISNYAGLEEVCGVLGLAASYTAAQGWQLHPADKTVLSSSPEFGAPAAGARLRRHDPPQEDSERRESDRTR